MTFLSTLTVNTQNNTKQKTISDIETGPRNPTFRLISTTSTRHHDCDYTASRNTPGLIFNVCYFLWRAVDDCDKTLKGRYKPVSDIPPLQWRHNEGDDVSNHRHLDCLLNRLFRCRSKKSSSKLRVTGHCEGNSPVTGEFPTQRASYAEIVSIWWHRGLQKI